jgi:anti-sigma B factor antagonist
MNFSKHEEENIFVITVNITEASMNHSENFKDYLYANCVDEAPKLVIDLSQVKYMDSSFIGALVAGLKHVLTKQGEMALVNVQNDVLALFELTRLDKVFKIHSTVSDAIRSLK